MRALNPSVEMDGSRAVNDYVVLKFNRGVDRAFEGRVQRQGGAAVGQHQLSAAGNQIGINIGKSRLKTIGDEFFDCFRPVFSKVQDVVWIVVSE